MDRTMHSNALSSELCSYKKSSPRRKKKASFVSGISANFTL